MKESKEDIIKELIFEATTRKMLLGKTTNSNLSSVEDEATDFAKSKNKVKTLWIVLKIAAVAIIIFVAVFLMQYQDKNSTTKDQYIASIYEVPMITKSRGNNPSVIDQNIELYDQGKYQDILSKLSETANEKDLWIKGHLLFALNKYDELKVHIENTVWQDKIYASDMEWLLALIDYREGVDFDKLIELYPNLTQSQIDDLRKGFSIR